MRRALGEMAKAGVAAPGRTEERVEALERRVASVEEEVNGLCETVKAQAKRLGELEARLTKLEESRMGAGEPESSVREEDSSAWTPPKRAYGLPDAGVVTLEEQPDEEDRRYQGQEPGRPSQSGGAQVGAGGGDDRRVRADAAA